MMSEYWLKILLPACLVALLALPFVLRETQFQDGSPENGFDLRHSMEGVPSKKLVIISPHWEGMKREFERAFSLWTIEKSGHATEVEWLDVGGTSDAMRFVRSEFTRVPSGIGVDLFFGGGVDPYLQLKALGLLQKHVVSEDVLKKIPRQFAGVDVYDSEYMWYGACLSGFGIIYNKQVLEIMDLPEPLTWDALGDKRYCTWVGSGDPRSSGSVHMVYEIILQAYGWEKGWAALMKMGGNIRGFSRSASQVPKDTALGEVACGLAIDVYAWRQIAEAGESRMGFQLPEGMTIVNPDGIAVLKGAPNADLAGLFIEFILSEQGQKLFILRPGAPGGPVQFALDRIPVLPGLAEQVGDDAVVRFDPYKWKGGFVYDSDKGSRRWGILNDLIGSFIIDPHDELATAWKAVMNLPETDPAFQMFTRPPLSESELMNLADTRWNEPEFRTKTLGQWAGMSKSLYRKVAGDKK